MPVYKDKQGKWYFKVSVKGTQYLKRGFSSKSEAKEQEMLFLLEVDKLKEPKVIKLYSLIDKYREHIAKKWKPTTVYHKNIDINKYIISSFPNIDVRSLSMQHFYRFRSKLAKSKLKHKNKMISLCIEIFEYIDVYYDIRIPYAKRLERFVDYNPLLLLEDPVNKPVSLKLFKKYYSLFDDYYKFLILTIYVTGIRLSELRGLELKAFNLKDGYVYIYKTTTSKIGSKKSVDLIPKSKSSIRKIYLSKEYIKRFKQFVKLHQLTRTDRLFYTQKTNNKKTPLSENAIRSHIQLIEKKYKLEHITLHGLRHGIATYLYDKGISDTDIGKYLGHKKNNVTMDVYIDLTKERQQNIVNIIDKFIKELD